MPHTFPGFLLVMTTSVLPLGLERLFVYCDTGPVYLITFLTPCMHSYIHNIKNFERQHNANYEIFMYIFMTFKQHCMKCQRIHNKQFNGFSNSYFNFSSVTCLTSPSYVCRDMWCRNSTNVPIDRSLNNRRWIQKSCWLRTRNGNVWHVYLSAGLC